ncbi:ABC-2 family transporter protein [Patescibacteria group bacterium]|nr:ABC-2 family transporter protein [Patescibacteria group bacterium]
MNSANSTWRKPVEVLILVINALVIALVFHILVLAIGILTTEVDNLIWVYRDATNMGRVPVDVYREPVRGLITFIIPIGIMMSFPVKALLGVLPLGLILFSIGFSISFLLISLWFWRFALSRYASASS